MARGARYYLLTSLPPVGELGSKPALSLKEFRARTAGSGAASLVDVVLLSDDMRHRQAAVAGEPVAAEALVLSPEVMSGKTPLSAPLAPLMPEGEPPPGRFAEDMVWEAYWRHAAQVARRNRSRFLAGWVRMEIALRNGVAAARARALRRPGAPEGVAEELGETQPLVERAVTRWAGAKDPLTAWRHLTRARWEWVKGADPRFTFSRDEVAAYAVRLLLVRDWHRTMRVTA